MENIIIIGIIVILVTYAATQTAKHFKGNSGCCGKSSYKHKKKKLSNVIMKKTFQIGGMHCEHCKTRVEEAVNGLAGVSGSVNLTQGTLLVLYEKEVADEIIINQITRAGYTAAKIK